MSLFLYTHPSSDLHVTPDGHPERVERMAAVTRALSASRFDDLERREPRAATRAEIARVHPEHYIDDLEAASPQQGHVMIDGDTYMAPGSLEAARRCAGAACEAVDAVAQGEAQRAFCAMRPPGHHAEPARGMGFCLFNSIAIGARHAIAEYGFARVAIVDFDVHHGNGTQAVFWDDPQMLFASTHQMPLYPGTGALDERGERGTIVNAPMSPGSDGETLVAAFEDRVLPALDRFSPDLVMISAGFDAHARDPLAQLNMYEDDFAWATRRITDVAEKHADGRVISMLEGGYDLAALEASVAVHVDVLRDI